MNSYYKKLKKLTQFIEEKRKQGWLLINKEGNVEKNSFVYTTGVNNKSISFFQDTGKNKIYYELLNSECTMYGEKNFKLESEHAYNDFIKDFFLIEPKTIHKLDEFNI